MPNLASVSRWGTTRIVKILKAARSNFQGWKFHQSFESYWKIWKWNTPGSNPCALIIAASGKQQSKQVQSAPCRASQSVKIRWFVALSVLFGCCFGDFSGQTKWLKQIKWKQARETSEVCFKKISLKSMVLHKISISLPSLERRMQGSFSKSWGENAVLCWFLIQGGNPLLAAHQSPEISGPPPKYPRVASAPHKPKSKAKSIKNRKLRWLL